MALLALISGWRILAGKYAGRPAPDGERFRFRSGSIGWGLFPVNYGHCLFGTVGQSAFSLELLWPFRFMSPRLVIHWTEVTTCASTTYWFFPVVEVKVEGFSGRILLRGSFGEAVRNGWASARGHGAPPLPNMPS
jgi:hypothetical protein